MGLPQKSTTDLPEPKGRSLLKPIGLSLALHLLLLPLLSKPFSSSTLQNASGLAPKVLRVRVPQNKFKPNLDIKGQVVDINNNNYSQKASENARFLSDRNRSVEKETQAKATGLPHPSAPPTPASNRSKVQGVIDGILGKGSQGKGSKEGFNLEVPEPFLKKLSSGQRQASLPPSNYLPDISFGDETILNTREYVYSSFFIRMKRQMEASWNPLQWVNRYQNDRGEYISAVLITLNSAGNVERVELVDSSGIQNLDNEAIQAVKSGAPYLNPPKELIGPDGKIQIGPWRFIVSMSGKL